MVAETTPRTAFLDAYRGFTILLVVAIHARAYADLPVEIASWVTLITSTIAVPSFFLCDGYLMVLRGAARLEAGYADYLRRSAQRLLVPWIVFSLFYTAARGLLEFLGLLEIQIVVGQSPWSILREIYSSGIAPQMYFLLSLFLIRVGAFFLAPLAMARKIACWLAFLGYTTLYREFGAETLRAQLSFGFDPILHAAWGLQFYLMGIVLARHREGLDRHAIRASAVAAVVFGSLLAFGSQISSHAATQYAYLLGTFFVFAAVGDRARTLSRLGRDSMGVYLLHAPILLRIVAMPTTMFSGVPVARYLLICMSAAALAWAGSKLLARSSVGRWAMGMSRVGKRIDL